MTESQVPYFYDPRTIASLTASLSAPRFAPYLQKANGNEAVAFELYLYNANLASSFLFPLSVAEVTLRNAIDGVLMQSYGADWHQNNVFRTAVLTPQSLGALDKAIERARNGNRGKVIAELTFDFWSNLFRKEYADLWRTKANISFPCLKHGEGRREIQYLVKDINYFRNRVAHHEPILDLNVADLHLKIIRLVELRCKDTADWMRYHSTVGAVMRTRPSLQETAPVTLASRADKRFTIVEGSTTLASLTGRGNPTSKAFVCVENGKVTGAITHQQIASYIMVNAAETNGVFDLNNHTVAHMLNNDAVMRGFREISAQSSFLDAVAILKEAKTHVIVAVNPDDGAPVGVILRAHRRY